MADYACPRCRSQDVTVTSLYMECLNCEVTADSNDGWAQAGVPEDKDHGAPRPYRFDHESAIVVRPRNFDSF